MVQLTDIDHALVDIDGTLCRNLPRICEYVGSRYGSDVDPVEVTEWNYVFEDAGVTMSEVTAELQRSRPEWYLSSLPRIRGARDGIEALSEAASVTIVTHRDPANHDITVEWLERHGFNYDDFLRDPPETKAEVDGDVLVDDFHGHVAEAVDAGMKGILINHPYNREVNHPRATTVQGWDEVVSLVNDRSTGGR